MSINRTLLLAVLVLPGLGAALGAQQQLAEYSDASGFICGLGDVDGDERADLAFRVAPGDSGVVRVVSGGTQLTLFSVTTDTPAIGFGEAIAGVGDVDGDGVPDLAIGAPLADVSGTNSGSVRVVSGVNGATLYTAHGDGPQDRMGVRLAGLGDTNGDGVPDFACVAADFSAADQHARILIRSGVDGSLLQQCGPTHAAAEYGWSICGPGDVNLDGFADVAFTNYLGGVYVHSGADGSQLWSVPSFIHEVSPGGDLDADGHPDLAVLDGYLFLGGYGRVLSGSTGEELLVVTSPTSSQEGQSFAGLGDVDGDGVPDYVLGLNPFPAEIQGQARVYSGASGQQLALHTLFLTTSALPPGYQFAAAVRAVGDVDGDGATDFGAHRGTSLGWVVDSARSSRFQQLSQLGGWYAPYPPGLLAGVGPLAPDSEVVLWMTSLPASAPTFLVIGLAPLSVPFKGGTLVPVPAILIGPVATNSAGALALSGRWPTGVPSATSFWFQGYALDPSAAQGVVGTSGLKATTP